MLENYLHLIEKFGFVPQANRIYFSRRSHPPVSSRFVLFYVTATNDQAFAKKAVPLLDSEFKAWEENIVTINGYKLYVYGDNTYGQRPEGYFEDTILASNLTTEADKLSLYSDLRAATESRFTFSSRWFIKNGTNDGSRVDTKCRKIIPVDLNSIMYRNCITIASFYNMSGNTAKVEEYEKIASDLLIAIKAVLWNEEDGIWYDYDLINNKQRKIFLASNFIPLASFAYDANDSVKIATGILKYISKNNLDSYMGGVPTSFKFSGENWDYPNVMPQLQWLIIAGLKGLNVDATNDLSKKWALRWLRTSFMSYKREGLLFDKVGDKI